jgi:hypothetical protein
LRDSVQLALVVGAIAAWILIGRYYEDRFGMVTQRGSAALSALGIIGWFAAWLAASKVDEGSPPVSVTSVLLAIFFALGAAQSRGRRWYALWPAGAFVILSLLPTAGVVSAEVVADKFIPITFGGALVLTGLLDHRLLVRHFPEPSDG